MIYKNYKNCFSSKVLYSDLRNSIDFPPRENISEQFGYLSFDDIDGQLQLPIEKYNQILEQDEKILKIIFFPFEASKSLINPRNLRRNFFTLNIALFISINPPCYAKQMNRSSNNQQTITKVIDKASNLTKEKSKNSLGFGKVRNPHIQKNKKIKSKVILENQQKNIDLLFQTFLYGSLKIKPQYQTQKVIFEPFKKINKEFVEFENIQRDFKSIIKQKVTTFRGGSSFLNVSLVSILILDMIREYLRKNPDQNLNTNKLQKEVFKELREILNLQNEGAILLACNPEEILPENLMEDDFHRQLNQEQIYEKEKERQMRKKTVYQHIREFCIRFYYSCLRRPELGFTVILGIFIILFCLYDYFYGPHRWEITIEEFEEVVSDILGKYLEPPTIWTYGNLLRTLAENRQQFYPLVIDQSVKILEQLHNMTKDGNVTKNE